MDGTTSSSKGIACSVDTPWAAPYCVTVYKLSKDIVARMDRREETIGPLRGENLLVKSNSCCKSSH